jgi:signal transduction histidine kinase
MQNVKPTFNITVPFWQQIRWRLMIYFVVLVLVVIVVVTVFTLIQVRNQTNQQVFQQLESVAQLKQNQISRWLQNADSVLDLIAADVERQFQLTDLLASGEVSQEQQLTITQALYEKIQLERDEEEIFRDVLIYTADGVVIAASNEVFLNRVVTLQPYFEPGFQQDEYVQSPYYDISTGELSMMITHALRTSSGEIIGIVAGNLNIDVLREFAAERSGLGETGETYLVSVENNYLLTPSRFEGYVMNRAYHSEGIDKALAGENGAGLYANYQSPGSPVIGVYRWIPELNAALLSEISEAEAHALFNQTSSAITGLVFVIVLLAGAVGLYASSSISQPIVQLTQTAARIAEGDLTQRATLRSSDEVGVLAQAFNRMTDKLTDSISQLDAKVDELNETNDALRVATAKAREAARVKGEFLANVSHELRTPLNAIIGFSDMLLMGMSGELNTKQRHKLERLKENGIRLLTLINNILDITRIEARRIEITNKPFSPYALVERLSSQMAVLAEQRHLEFKTVITPDLPATLIGDEQRVEQVVVNLLSNAFKFTEEGTVTLEVSADMTAQTWNISVSDTGIGIPPHAINLIFEEFRQVDGGSARAYKGSGLGLAITRNLVRIMNGHIAVKSNPGEGSTFTVTLPIINAQVEDYADILEQAKV